MSAIPDRIGRYEVISLLGQGGMGVLYLARDPVIDRHVALKLLRVDNDDLRRRFVREARSAGRLQHPNIVTVYDVGEHEGELFIAMEYIDGDTLATLIRDEAPFSTLRKLEMLDQLADGLGFAHERGIIHRDIKPANLMVTRGGLLKVLDFGIARINRADAVLSVAGGAVLGTPAYMAPEQIQGEDLDHRADIFAVGVVMYELLSGARAFAGPTAADVLERVLTAEPTPLEELVPTIDPDLVRSVARAIAKHPNDRYQDLQSLRNDLARVRRRVELDSGAFDATVVVQVPPIRRQTELATRNVGDGTTTPVTAPPEGDPPGQVPTPTAPVTAPQPASEPGDADETIVAPVFVPEAASRPASPPPAASPLAPPPLPAEIVAASAAEVPTPAGSHGGVAAPRRRSMVPALIVIGVIVLMLAGGTIAALWWVRAWLSDRLQPTVATAETTPGQTSTASYMPGSNDVPATATDVPVDALAEMSDEAPSSEATLPPQDTARVPQAVATPPPSVGDTRTPPAPSSGQRDVAQPVRPIAKAPASVAAAETAPVVKSQAAPSREEVLVPQDEAVALVRAYVAARNTGHAAGMRRVWPTISDTDVRRMTSEFSAPLTLSGCDVVNTDGGRMRATCQLTQPGTTGFSEGTALTIRRQLVFAMERQGRNWVITDVTQ